MVKRKGLRSKSKPEPNFQSLGPKDALKLIEENKNNSKFIILDVRTSEEFNNGHIAGAANVDFYDPNFSVILKKLNVNKTYLVYCRSGSRSSAATSVMREIGFISVYNLQGGIVSWRKKGYSVV